MNKIENFNYQEWWEKIKKRLRKEIILSLYDDIQEKQKILASFPPKDIKEKVENYSGTLIFSNLNLTDISFIKPFKKLKNLSLDENQVSKHI